MARASPALTSNFKPRTLSILAGFSPYFCNSGWTAMYCNKYRTDEYSETLSIEALARACSFCSPPIPTPPLFLSNFQHVPTRSASKTAFNLGIFVSQCPIITTTGVLFDCPPFREPLHQDQLLRISQTVIAQNPSAHLHLLRIPVCMRKVSCDSRHWQVQDASRLGELVRKYSPKC